jgi:dGTPase
MQLPATTAEREACILATYAMHSAQSRGRKHPEVEQSYRSAYQRDRDRIVHTSAFRRLSGKMQVFTGDMGDYHRTRLTHTHEVASIARTIGRALRLNEDFVEALALFHDIGHPPFGHAGEDALNDCLHDEGGFSHNRHALTIAEELEHPYADFAGLNLTFEVLESQATRIRKGETASPPLLEAQVVEAADSMTYDAHDSDDAMKLRLVTLEELEETSLVREVVQAIRARFTNVVGDKLRRAVARELLDRQVRDILHTSAKFLETCEGLTAEEVRRMDFRVGPSAELRQQKLELERLLYQRVYRHPRLMEMRAGAQARLKQMFTGLVERPELLPNLYRMRARSVGVRRAAGDYLAGMTDRFCDQQYALHFWPGRVAAVESIEKPKG